MNRILNFSRFVLQRKLGWIIILFSGTGVVQALSIDFVASQNETRRVTILADIRLEASEPLDPHSVSTQTVKLFRVGGSDQSKILIDRTVRYDTATRRILIAPLRPLDYDAKYEVALAGIRTPSGETKHVDDLPPFRTVRNVVARKIFYRQGRITQYQNFQYDAQGRLTERAEFGAPGGDLRWLDSTDELTSLVTYEHGPNELLVSEVYYDGSGPDERWRTADDRVGSYYRVQYDRRGNPLRTLNAFGPGSDKTWFDGNDETRDCVSYDYDDRDNVKRRVQYLNAGKDAQSFTVDDTVSYYETFVYDEQGELLHSFKFNAAGTDGVWFTDDDAVEGVSVLLPRIGGQAFYNSPGADGLWLTADDKLDSYRVTQKNRQSYGICIL